MSETDPEALNREVFPDGDQVLRDALGRDQEFWDAYAEEFKEEPVLGANLGGRLMQRRITGTSETGAKVMIRDFDTEVFHRMPKPGEHDPPPVDETSGQLVDYLKGIAIQVTPPGGEDDTRSVELYVPDYSEAHPDIEPPHAVTFETTHDDQRTKKIMPAEDPVPEDQGLFEKGVEEIKFYLGDRVIWDSPEGKEVPDRPIPGGWFA
jgi:hypothetical protein